MRRHGAMQLLKLETILNVATLGYNVLWLEPHTLAAGEALPEVCSCWAAQRQHCCVPSAASSWRAHLE